LEVGLQEVAWWGCRGRIPLTIACLEHEIRNVNSQGAVGEYIYVRESNRKLENAAQLGVPHKLHASSNIVRVMKSRRMRLAVRVVHMGEIRSTYNF
jgi:hypothetical protein